MMEFKKNQREFYKTMSADDQKTFRQALADGERKTLEMLVDRYNGNREIIKGTRTNTNRTEKSQEERNTFRTTLFNEEQPKTFPQIERVEGEIVEDNIEEFKRLYQMTCAQVLRDYKEENEDLVKRHPYLWYKPLLIRLKRNTPKVSADEVEKLEVVWDILKDFMAEIGMYITYETYCNLLSIHDYQLVKRGEVNPKYVELRKKIFIERDEALMDELQHNPYSQPNKIFVAKTHGILEQTQSKTIEVIHTTPKLDEIPIFGIDQKSENN